MTISIVYSPKNIDNLNKVTLCCNHAVCILHLYLLPFTSYYYFKNNGWYLAIAY